MCSVMGRVHIRGEEDRKSRESAMVRRRKLGHVVLGAQASASGRPEPLSS